jgi:hypothetical protein
VLHGIAGSSHFLGVVPALALPTRAASLIYIAAFGIGTVAAMTAFAAAAALAGGQARHASTAHRLLLGGTAFASLAVGSVWLLA